MVRNLVIQRLVSGAIKADFRPYIRQYTSQNEQLMNSNYLRQFIMDTLSQIYNVIRSEVALQ